METLNIDPVLNKKETSILTEIKSFPQPFSLITTPHNDLTIQSFGIKTPRDYGRDLYYYINLMCIVTPNTDSCDSLDTINSLLAIRCMAQNASEESMQVTSFNFVELDFLLHICGLSDLSAGDQNLYTSYEQMGLIEHWRKKVKLYKNSLSSDILGDAFRRGTILNTPKTSTDEKGQSFSSHGADYFRITADGALIICGTPDNNFLKPGMKAPSLENLSNVGKIGSFTQDLLNHL